MQRKRIWPWNEPFGDEDSLEIEGPTPEQVRKHRAGLRLKYWLSLVAIWVVGIVFLVSTCTYLIDDKMAENYYWDHYTAPTNLELAEHAKEISIESGATQVECGTYLENLESIDIVGGTYDAVWLVWFSWEGNEELDFTDNFRIYKGVINDGMEVVKDYTAEDGSRYQRFRIHTTVSKVFMTPRYPLDSHQLRMYIEPDYSVLKVNLKQSAFDDELNPNMSVGGYEIKRMNAGIEYVSYESDFDDPEVTAEGHVIKSEHMNQIEINRDGFGLYFRCFIALWATIVWCLIMLFAATRHKVDAFEFIPETLFGAAANILVGAALLPESEMLGLLEFGNVWGIFIIIAATISILVMNRERTHWRNDVFAERYGRIMLLSCGLLAIIGSVALPLSAYMF